MSTTSLIVIVAAGIGVVVLRRVLGARTLDATWLAFARVPFNALAFHLRRAIGWRRGLPIHVNEPKDALFDYVDTRLSVELDARERALRDRYALGPLAARSTRDVYRDNLYVLDLLDRFVAPGLRSAILERPHPTHIRAVDVGSKDFRYAFAIERFIATTVDAAAATSKRATESPAVDLLGVELDGHPIYPDLHSRADHADAYVGEVEAAPRPGRAPSRVRYRVANYLAVAESELDVVTFFFPFVLRYTLVRWGLPLGEFVPDRLFEHAARSLRAGGLLVVVNHTEEELAAQRAILARIPSLEVLASADAQSHLVDYHADLEGRTLTLARKRAP